MSITINDAINYFEDVENLTGIEAQNVRQLTENATSKEIEDAFDADRSWFKSFGESIINAV